MSPACQPIPLALASTSPRRAELMRAAGYVFEIIAPPMVEPEERRPHVDPGSYAESLAFFKASSIADQHPTKHILSADTVAYIDGEIIGKPGDRADAGRILKKLSNTTHQVVTGVALIHPATERRHIAHEVSMIRCRPLSDEMIEAYLDTGQWQGIPRHSSWDTTRRFTNYTARGRYWGWPPGNPFPMSPHSYARATA